jgi:nitroreductase
MFLPVRLPAFGRVTEKAPGPARLDPTDAVASAATRSPMSLALDVLDLARWAPSGDNSQPWRFEVLGDDRVRVHAFDTRRHCVYDLEGHASQLSVGAMLETIRIAARARGFATRIERLVEAPIEAPVFGVRFERAGSGAGDELEPAIRERSVMRRPLSRRPLQADHKRRLEDAVGSAFRVRWFDTPGEKRALAWLAVSNAKIRLTIPEAYAVHREIIAWDARYSDDRVPDQALGADALSLRSMRWAMASWERVRLMNRWFGGTLAPRLQLDLLPGLLCAAHFALVAQAAPRGIDDYVDAGAAVQRFWLTATRLGLQLQPQYTPLVFAEYVRRGVAFTSVQPAKDRAVRIERRLAALLDEKTAPATMFLGRVGYGKPAEARSLRLPLERLLLPPAP